MHGVAHIKILVMLRSARLCWDDSHLATALDSRVLHVRFMVKEGSL